jgi:hypothetical protein
VLDAAAVVPIPAAMNFVTAAAVRAARLPEFSAGDARVVDEL